MGFGYPFQNPENGPQISRTRHLPKMTVPSVLVQGCRDVYGPAGEVSTRYALARTMRLVPVATTHDFEELEPAELEWVRMLLLGLFTQPMQPAGPPLVQDFVSEDAAQPRPAGSQAWDDDREALDVA